MRTNLNPNQPAVQNRSPRNDGDYRRGGGYRRYSGRAFRPYREWVKVARITVEQAERSVRIRFPEKPADHERQILKDHNFSWSGASGFWYARLTPENVAFALALEKDGFPPEPEPPAEEPAAAEAAA